MTSERIFEEICRICADLFDKAPTELHQDTGLFSELGAESIDLLELDLAISRKLNLSMDDERAFLRLLRLEAVRLEGALKRDRKALASALAEEYPHLRLSRLESLIRWALSDDPVHPLTVGDILDYLVHLSQNAAPPGNE